MFENEVVEWRNRIQSCENGKKLRTYKLFKHSFSTEKYITCNMAKSYRSAYAKFRCGVAPSGLKQEDMKICNINERKCFYCMDDIEDEVHVITKCPLYSESREVLYDNARRFLMLTLMFLSDKEKFVFMFECAEMCGIVAKTCYSILLRRNSFLYR